MTGKTLPAKSKETNVAHLLVLNECFNTVGKEGWWCHGFRRECPTEMCCGDVKDSAGTEIRESCQTKTATTLTEGDTDPKEYTFACKEKTGAERLMLAASAMIAISTLMM